MNLPWDIPVPISVLCLATWKKNKTKFGHVRRGDVTTRCFAEFRGKKWRDFTRFHYISGVCLEIWDQDCFRFQCENQCGLMTSISIAEVFKIACLSDKSPVLFLFHRIHSTPNPFSVSFQGTNVTRGYFGIQIDTWISFGTL